ncbi:hypothetical protein O6H91_Y114900 [Diphasiastrum complanatum]|nr:hypothetical protein O6H91_Y114900 [Diphasiastrum complanatum]
MPGCVKVSVLEAENLPPTVTEGKAVSVRVSVGKREFDTPTKNAQGGRTSPWNFEFSYPVFNLRDNLVISVLGNTEEIITRSEIQTASIIERGYWDAYFSFKEGGKIHLKLGFVLTDEERRKVEQMRAATMKRKKHEDVVVRKSDQILWPAAKRGTKSFVSGVTITEIPSESSESEKGSGYMGDHSGAVSSVVIAEDNLFRPTKDQSDPKADAAFATVNFPIEPQEEFESQTCKQIDCQQIHKTSGTTTLLPPLSTETFHMGSTGHSHSQQDFMSEDHACHQPFSAEFSKGALYSSHNNLQVKTQQASQTCDSASLAHSSNSSEADVDMESSLLLPEVSALMTDLASSLSSLQGTVKIKDNDHSDCHFSILDSTSVLALDHAVLSCCTCTETMPHSSCAVLVSNGPTSCVEDMEIAFEATSSADLPSVIWPPRSSAKIAQRNSSQPITDEASQTSSDCSLKVISLKTTPSSTIELNETVHMGDKNVGRSTTAAEVVMKAHMVPGGTIPSLADKEKSSSPGGSRLLEGRGIEQIRAGTVKARILAFEANVQQEVHQVKLCSNRTRAEESGLARMKDPASTVEQIKTLDEAPVFLSAEKKFGLLDKVQQWENLQARAHRVSWERQKLEERPFKIQEKESMVPEKNIHAMEPQYNEDSEAGAWKSVVSEGLRDSSTVAEEGREVNKDQRSNLLTKKNKARQFTSKQGENMAPFTRENGPFEISLPPEMEDRGMVPSNFTAEVPIKVSQLKFTSESEDSSRTSEGARRIVAGENKQMGSEISPGRESFKSQRGVAFGKDRQFIPTLEPQQVTLAKSYQQSELLTRNGARNMHAWDSSRPETSSGLRISEGSKQPKSSEGIACRMKQVISGAVLLAGVVILGNDAIQRDLASEKERYYVVKEGDTLCSIVPGQWNNPNSLFYQLNPEIFDRNLIYPGQRFRLY